MGLIIAQLGLRDRALHVALHASAPLGAAVDRVHDVVSSAELPPLLLNTTGWSAGLTNAADAQDTYARTGRASSAPSGHDYVYVSTGPHPLGPFVPLGQIWLTSDLLTDVTCAFDVVTPSVEVRRALRRAMPSLRTFYVAPRALQIAIELDAAVLGSLRPGPSTAPPPSSLVSRVDLSVEPADLRTPINLVALPSSVLVVFAAHGRVAPRTDADAMIAASGTTATADTDTANTDTAANKASHTAPTAYESVHARVEGAPVAAPSSLWPRFSRPPRDLLFASHGLEDGGWVGTGVGVHSAVRRRSFLSCAMETLVSIAHDVRAEALARHEDEEGSADMEVIVGVVTGKEQPPHWAHAKLSGLSSANRARLGPALRLTGSAEGDGVPAAADGVPPGTARRQMTTHRMLDHATPPPMEPVDLDIELGDILGVGTTIGGRFSLRVLHGKVTLGGAFLLNSTGVTMNATLSQGCLGGGTDSAATATTATVTRRALSPSTCFTPLDVAVLIAPTDEPPSW